MLVKFKNLTGPDGDRIGLAVWSQIQINVTVDLMELVEDSLAQVSVLRYFSPTENRSTDIQKCRRIYL